MNTVFDFEFVLVDEQTGIESEKKSLEIGIIAETLLQAAKDAQAYIFDRVEPNYAVKLFYQNKLVDF